MFCPKCGTQNVETARFCRVCGTDLSLVSDALTGKLVSPESFAVENKPSNEQDSADVFGEAIRDMLIGFAFIVAAVVLGTTGAAGGKSWWFWLLIPACAMIGKSIGDFVKYHSLKKKEEAAFPNSNFSTPPLAFNRTPTDVALPPPNQTDNYVAPARQSFFGTEAHYKTGELVESPPSITENTTRRLEINSEGEKTTLLEK